MLARPIPEMPLLTDGRTDSPVAANVCTVVLPSLRSGENHESLSNLDERRDYGEFLSTYPLSICKSHADALNLTPNRRAIKPWRGPFEFGILAL